MLTYQNSVSQVMLANQPQGVMMAQQPAQITSTGALQHVGLPGYGFMTGNGQPMATAPMLMQQQRPMIMQNRPVTMNPMASQQYSITAQSMPMAIQQQQYPAESTAQQQGQPSLCVSASAASKPINPSTQCRTSILSQTQSLARVKGLDYAQPQNLPTRKSVTINLKPDINSPPNDSNIPGTAPDRPSTSTLQTESSDQTKCSFFDFNPAQNPLFNQIGPNCQRNQYNNSGEINSQTGQLSDNYAHYFGKVSGMTNGFYSSYDVPSVDPPTSKCFNSKQQPSQTSNTLYDQLTSHATRTPPSVDSQPYMLTKALQELSDEKTTNHLPDIEAISETMLESSLSATKLAEDSQGQSSMDPAGRIKVLKTKQTVMECVMRKLLRSMKEIHDLDPDGKNKAEAEAQHRLKMARMMQLLMLQRKNLQLQIDALMESENCLLQKHQCLKTYSEGCVAENLELNKKYRKLQADQDSKDSQIKALMQLSCKLQKKLEDHAHTELALENMAHEVKRLVYENENLKAASRQLESCNTENTKEHETLILQKNQLKMDLDRIRAELANQRVRTDKVSSENSSLRNQLSLAEAGSKAAAKKSVEYGQLKEAYENLQFDHQRLQMLYISETETRRELHNQLQEVNGNIRVINRFRPAEKSDEECDSPFEFCAMDKLFVCGKSIPSTVTYQRQLGYNQPQAYVARDEFFSFNRVFQEDADQDDIFEEIRPIVGSFVDGYNVCILAYGPTGSGKTYTMQGTKTCPGICRRAVAEVFELCDPLQGSWGTEINVAMFEIHNEVIYDLLSPQIVPVKLCDNGSDVRLVNAEEKITTSEQETMHWIERGYVRRKVSSTRRNCESSSSHLIIRIHLNLVSTIDNQRRTSSLVLCDLAGSESAERIEADEMLHMETRYINRSLVTLARVFETLRRKSGQCASTGLAIPYRDSKLTHLLKPCLGGQAKFVLIVTTSPDQAHLDRTLKALEFAQRAMQVSLGRPTKNIRILASNQTPKS